MPAIAPASTDARDGNPLPGDAICGPFFLLEVASPRPASQVNGVGAHRSHVRRRDHSATVQSLRVTADVCVAMEVAVQWLPAWCSRTETSRQRWFDPAPPNCGGAHELIEDGSRQATMRPQASVYRYSRAQTHLGRKVRKPSLNGQREWRCCLDFCFVMGTNNAGGCLLRDKPPLRGQMAALPGHPCTAHDPSFRDNVYT